MREPDHVRRDADGRLEAEGTSHELKVVVDCLRDADDGNLEPAAEALVRHVAGAAQRTVAAHAEEDVDVHPLERVDDLLRRLLSARGAENRPALRVNRVNNIGIEHQRLVTELRDEPRVAVADAEDGLHAIAEEERLDQPLDDVVETGTESARRDDPHARPGRIVENLRQGTRPLEGRQMPKLLFAIFHEPFVLVREDALPFVDELLVPDRRGDLALAQSLHAAGILLGICRNLI